MIRITRKPEKDAKVLTLAEVNRFVQECVNAGIPPETLIEATTTVALTPKLKVLAAEG